MKNRNTSRQRGFTIIELMVSMLILTVISGAVFSQIDVAQQRATTEQNKLDIFQETRDFMDQMTRDLHQAGYPNPHNFAAGQLMNGIKDSHAAVGLVLVDKDRIFFEGDVDGVGTVSSVQYELKATGDGCPCLERGVVTKVTGFPLPNRLGGDQSDPIFYTEIQHVQNGTGDAPIFMAYDSDDNQIPVTSMPIDFVNQPKIIAKISTIKVILTAQSPHADLKTGQKPSVTMVSTIKLNNCSQAASGLAMSCQ